MNEPGYACNGSNYLYIEIQIIGHGLESLPHDSAMYFLISEII